MDRTMREGRAVRGGCITPGACPSRMVQVRALVARHRAACDFAAVYIQEAHAVCPARAGLCASMPARPGTNIMLPLS
jgi:hypothetical protein